MRYADIGDKIKNESAGITRFFGVYEKEGGSRGSLYDAMNVSSRAFPSMLQRERRATVRMLGSADGIFADDTLAFVDGGRLYYGARQISGLYLASGEKTLLRLGKYLLVFPDEAYVDLENEERCGFLSSAFSGSVKISTVDAQKNDISYSVFLTEPQSGAIGEYCAVSDGDGGLVMKRFDGAIWRRCETFLKISASGIDGCFNEGDMLSVSGADGALGSAVRVTARESGAIYCEGVITSDIRCELSLTRSVPLFDFVTVSGGRLVGVRRGKAKNGAYVSRIYASAQGDPFNFLEEGGALMLDVDISGAFTGVCDYLGSPIAFSESEIVECRVKGQSLIGTVIRCCGLESGAHKSCVTDNGILYYKSSMGVCRYDGSYPEVISDALFGIRLGGEGCPAICAKGRYYIKLTDSKSRKAIYVYDIGRKLWLREDDPGIVSFAKRRENVYALCRADQGSIMLFDYDSADPDEQTYCSAEGYPRVEEAVQWYVETSEIGADTFESVCPVSLSVRLIKSAKDTTWACAVCDGKVISETEIKGECFGAVSVPVDVTRCDTFRIRLRGSGECKILGLSALYRAKGEVKAWR